MKYRYLVILVAALFFTGIDNLKAQTKIIPAGYYENTNGLTGEALKQALHNIIDDHTKLSYDDLWEVLPETDEDPNNNQNFILIYTGRSIPKTEVYPAWNREHVWAKSHGDFGTTPPAGTDAHHLRPEDVSVNSARGNKDFDEGGTQHSEATECYYTSNTWEPRDAVKGDVARMMFYMTVRYEGDVSGEPDLELVDYVTNPSTQPIFGVLSTLLRWHQEDPVDDFERNRNEVIYSHQRNRNPFVDHPEFVAQIWGGNSGSVINNLTTQPETPSSTDSVTVLATIEDAEGIDQVSLFWGTSTADLNQSIAMTPLGNDIFKTSSAIPAHTDGTTVWFQIKVTDATNNITISNNYSYTIGGNAGEQVILLDEDFESCKDNEEVALSGWINETLTGNRKWLARLYSNNLYAQATSYQSGEENISWLITPKINLNTTKDEVFTFDINVGYWKHHGFAVLLSQNFDGTNVAGASWQDITSHFTIPATPTNAYGTFKSAGNFDLSTYSGTVYIAFRYSGSESGGATQTTTYQIDNVKVTGISMPTDVTAPVLTLLPEDGTNQVDLQPTIWIKANEPMKKPSGEALDSSFILSVVHLGNAHGAVSYTLSISDDQTSITCLPKQPLNYETTYTLLVDNQAFADASGNLTSMVQCSFTTLGYSDSIPPVLSITPIQGATHVDPAATIRISSNEILRAPHGGTITLNYLSSVISLNQEGTDENPLSYTASIGNDSMWVSLKPVNQFAYETNYQVKVAHHAFADSSGNLTDSIQTIFTIKPELDTKAPVFVPGYPKTGGVGAQGFNIILSMDEPGKIFYQLKLKAEAGPTLDQILASDHISVDEGYDYDTLSFNGLEANTTYAVYLLTQDNQPAPNTAPFSLKYLVTTMGISPAITSQPEDQHVCKGNLVRFSVQVDGTGPFNYEWYHHGEPLAGTNNDTLMIANVQTDHVGEYRCQISNPWGIATSTGATLAIIPEVFAGTGTQLTVKTEVTSVNLWDLLMNEPTPGGDWIDLDGSEALTDGIFNPKQAGEGIFRFQYFVQNSCMTDTSIVTIQVESPEELAEWKLFGASIFPNPTSGMVTLQVPIPTHGVKAAIISTEGRVLQKLEWDVPQSRYEFSMTPFGKGYYFVILTLGDEHATYSIVVE